VRTNRTLILALAWPAMASAQDTAPPGLAEVEVARSRSCVATLGRMAELDAALDPFARRIQRMRELANAVVLEDSTGVVPFDAADPMDSAVRSWFAEDGALALENVEAPSDSLLEERSTGRERILQVLRDEVSAVQASAETPMAEAAEVDAEARTCQGAMFVRSAVLEACETTESPLCGPASRTEAGSFQFVEDPEDLWDIEQFRPWTDPGRLGRAPDGTLGGARTFASVRKGNVAISVGVSPIIRARSELTPEQIAEFEANLDSLGFQFDHPDFVMAPGMDVAANLPDPIGGETHYILHFGEVTSPQVIWTLPIQTGGYVQRVFPAPGPVLALLQEGAGLTVTAIRAPEEEGGEPEAVFSLGLLTVNQTSAVTALLGYMSGGGLSTDLAALVPPS
jgi:hypothetical protein